MSDPAALQGHCRCRAVTYSTAGKPSQTIACHCRDCQYASGSAFSILSMFPTDQVDIRGPVSRYAVKGSAGLTVTRSFCPTCGTPMFSQISELPDLILVKTVTLDEPKAFEPQAHVWCDSRLGWVRLDDNVPQLPGNPPLA